MSRPRSRAAAVVLPRCHAVAAGVLGGLAILACNGSIDGGGGAAAADAEGAAGPDAAPAACTSAATCAGGAICLDGSCGPAPSCLVLAEQRPSTPDGPAILDPDGDGPAASFSAYCDMTRDGGGWMLVSPEMLGERRAIAVTEALGTDARGGAVVRVYVNSTGCGAGDDPQYFVPVAAAVPWTELRAYYLFAGGASVWSAFGDTTFMPGPPIDMIPFDPAIDVIRSEVRMGGAGGDDFDGLPHRADNTPANFWLSTHGTTPRTAEVLLRRGEGDGPAGLGTGAACCDPVGPTTTSATFWDYSNIYVR